MRPLAFKLLTLALTVFLLLSFLLPIPVFAKGRLRAPDVDEQPLPGAARNLSFYVVIKTTYGFVLMPVFVKSSNALNTTIEGQSTISKRANEIVE